MTISIHPMTEADFDAALALWAATEGLGMTESDTPELLRAFLERNPGLSLVARDGSKLVAAVLCGHDGRRGFLYHLAVAAEYRNRGLGKRIVEACLAALGEIGIRKCNILLYTHNEPGERFWKRNGWNERVDLKLLQHEIAPGE